jgi:hypothetical protein
MSALDEFKKMLQQAQKGDFEVEPEIEEIQEEVIPELSPLEQLKDLLREAAPHYIPKEIVEESIKTEIETLSEKDIVQMTADLLSKSNRANNIPAAPQDIESQRWNDPLRNTNFVTQKQMNEHYNLFLQRIQQQMSTIGGGGEVWLRNLNDVDRSTMTPSNNNWLLEWDSTTKKAKFTNELGPVDNIRFDRTHTHLEERVVGTLCWSPEDQTLNIEHPGGVTQQVGQESYAYVRNGTANTIVNGTPVMFVGAEDDGGSGARLLVGPIVANGTFPSLYGLGIATQDLDPAQDGRVTVWGKVRDLNTSAWEIGDILYADPDNAGQLTNVKPTAPNNVIPFAAVLKKDAETGEIFVRPTVEQQKYYGRFSRLTDVTAANPNQAYTIAFDTVDISNGVTIGGPSNTHIEVADSGFYNFSVSAQVSATSNKGRVYLWFRKNGVDIPNSTRATTVTNGDTFNVATTISISLDANDYVEMVWARTATGIILDAVPATAFAPSSGAITLDVAQTQL